ncbi:hypothetical protein EJ06DRAFT_546662 [Trichodelitschia bisporula]|uniref:Uncharacterized protein n=1 Tax=Trichodelitschia bisporula TaxID=703511 RepID=A0A6G1I513_9PEZI|nr:hypothetical protein EJ06DRAFT_546662 [Trichodelitschia bisporula]
MFFKRLSRGSRSNSYIEDFADDNSPSRSPHAPLDSPRASNHQHNTLPDRGISDRGIPSTPTTKDAPPFDSKEMYSRSQPPADPYARAAHTNGMSHGSRNSMAVDPAPSKAEGAPDMLLRAWAETLRPYTDKIEQLENQVADLQNFIDQLEHQRGEVHSWIDKRGLRPDVPPSIAKVMDAQPDAATTLNAQLDRKITIVNFDLHRLQDDLNDSISTAHFASAMTKFLPDISRLSALPGGGAKFGFDLILKLGGNLNSHGGLDSGDPADLSARRDFYAQLDQAMVEVVRRRFQDGEDWPVGREIKRIEKTAAYLRNFGVEPYFPATLDAMRREVDYRGAAPQGGVPPAAHSPPRYQ